MAKSVHLSIWFVSSGFGLFVPLKGNLNAEANNNILDNNVLPFWDEMNCDSDLITNTSVGIHVSEWDQILAAGSTSGRKTETRRAEAGILLCTSLGNIHKPDFASQFQLFLYCQCASRFFSGCKNV